MCACTHVYASWSRGMVRRIWLWNTVILIDNNAHVCTCSSSFPFCLGQGSDFKYRLTTGRRGWRIYVELFVNDSYKIEVFRIDTLVLISVSLFLCFIFFFNVKNLMQTVVMEKGKGIHKMSVNDHACFEYLYNYFILAWYICAYKCAYLIQFKFFFKKRMTMHLNLQRTWMNKTRYNYP